jgi:hypothetical protein
LGVGRFRGQGPGGEEKKGEAAKGIKEKRMNAAQETAALTGGTRSGD